MKPRQMLLFTFNMSAWISTNYNTNSSFVVNGKMFFFTFWISLSFFFFSELRTPGLVSDKCNQLQLGCAMDYDYLIFLAIFGIVYLRRAGNRNAWEKKKKAAVFKMSWRTLTSPCYRRKSVDVREVRVTWHQFECRQNVCDASCLSPWN